MPSQSYFRHSDSRVFQSFHRPETMTSYVLQKVEKTFFFSVRFVFEKTTYMTALTSSENPGCVHTKRATDSPLPGSLHKCVGDLSEGWSCVPSGIPAYSQSSPAQLINRRQSYSQRLITKHINNKSETTTNTLLSRSQNYRAS